MTHIAVDLAELDRLHGKLFACFVDLSALPGVVDGPVPGNDDIVVALMDFSEHWSKKRQAMLDEIEDLVARLNAARRLFADADRCLAGLR